MTALNFSHGRAPPGGLTVAHWHHEIAMHVAVPAGRHAYPRRPRHRRHLVEGPIRHRARARRHLIISAAATGAAPVQSVGKLAERARPEP
ncbi:hypothetical protein [Nonomuraea basaltis]|uniref:hypothetical protein n=1 Tax=Nonomuraea basaltis TaxID=2495887 RepID=UPI00148673EB|nr:hypothetical protein [Nonomuraea basaltis]